MIRRVLVLATVAFFALVATALADSPNPIPGTETATTAPVFDSSGVLIGRQLTVSGQWSWSGQRGSCDNHGLSNPPQGVAVSWQDASQPGNAVANDPNPPHELVLVGTASANSLNPADNAIHANPCGTFNQSTNQTVGNWGPLSHVYPLSTTGDLHICPVTYHVKDTSKTAGGPNRETDNSIETNNAGVDVGCFTFAFPGLATTASPATTIGSSISDVATLSGTDPGQAATGTVSWALYRFDAGTTITSSSCTVANQVATGPLSSTVMNDSATSPSFTPTSPGTYQWTATYSGDSHNAGVGPVGCGVTGEQTVVGKAQPGLSTSASPSVVVGSSISDVATLSGGDSPSGTVTWNVYGPLDTGCSTPLNSTPLMATVTAGKATSPGFVANVAGTYRWIATYLGDVNNKGAMTSCTESAESVVVSQAKPAIATTATGNGPIGTAISDSASLTGGFSPTGSITFTLYGPNDPTCAGPVAFTTTNSSVTNDGSYPTPSSFTPSRAGTYQWIATYNGDVNNVSVSTLCGDSGETVTTGPLTPQLTTNSDSGGPLGTAIHDVGHLSGATSGAGGSITFTLYGPNDAACGTAIFTSPPVPVSGAGSYASPSFTPTAAGTYRWIAAYTGDTNNKAVSTACNDPNESSVVSSTPGIGVVKFQRIDGSSDPFTHDVLTVAVGQKIDYEMVVSNTGDVPLALSFSDPHCDAGTVTGPTGDLNPDGTLKPHGQATYFCSHIAAAGDAPTFTNTVTVTGTPPGGPPVGPASSTVVANVAQQRVSPCTIGSVALAGAVGCTRHAFQAVVQTAPNTVRSVTFLLDGRKIRTLTHVGAGNRWAITINPGRLRFGGHTLTAEVTLICNGARRTEVLHFRHCKPPSPRFTG